MFKGPASVRARIFALVVIAIGPALGLILYTASERRRDAVLDAQNAAFGVARIAAVAAGTFGHGALSRIAAVAPLPPGADVVLLDADGIVIARHPDPDLWAGRHARQTSLWAEVKSQNGAGVAQVAGLDTVERIVAFVPVRSTRAPGATIVVGIPRVGALKEADRLLARDLIGLAAAAILAFVAGWVGADRHARAFARIAADLEDITRRHKTILNAAGEGIYGLDLAGNFTFMNPAGARMLGYDDPAELIGSASREVLLSDDVYRRRDGSWIPVEFTSGMINEGDEVVGAVVVFKDVSDRHAQTDALRHQATHDALTGLPNRTLLHDRLEVAIRAARRDKRSFALLLMDLDHFKEINDTLGHPCGDLVLKAVGPRVHSAIRESDTVARLGGDEFAVLLRDVDNALTATAVAEKILKELGEPLGLEEQTLRIGASIGIAVCPEHGEDADTLLRRADVAMYTAKQNRSGCVVYATTQDQHSKRRLAMMADLRTGIEAGQLYLVYQPKVDLRSRRVTGVEALVRWQHPELGTVPPDQFIPLAEQTGLIKPLTKWVLGEALKQCAAWRKEGHELSVAVNLTARNLQDPLLPGLIHDLLEKEQAAPSWLEIEMTESSLMTDPVRAVDVLTKLARQGVRVAIDDFGTGYSSLAYLRRLPVREIKIDRSFVMGAGTNANDSVIVRSTIELGHNLGLKVVAEGVEDEETYERLASHGCDAAQGYFISRPLLGADLASWLRTSKLVPASGRSASTQPGSGSSRIARIKP